MQWLMVKRQHGKDRPYWYPLYGDVTLSQEAIDFQLTSFSRTNTVVEHKVVDDGKTEEQHLAEERAAALSEARFCDPSYIHDARFGGDNY